MNLKNYTSKTPARSSLDLIEHRLIAMGASNISKRIEKGAVAGITFTIEVSGNTIAFNLPANIKACFDVFWLEIRRPAPDTKKRLEDQAERTAWKIIADWVEVQAAMIRLKQAEPMQVFLPYALTKGGETVYETIKSGGLKMLT